jgi:hypothetical protein
MALWGDLARLEQDVVAGGAVLAELEARGAAPTPADVQRACAEFRTARMLLAADELTVWLEHWGLDDATWRAHVRRGLARALAPQPSPSSASPPSVIDVWAEAVGSRLLGTRAYRLATRVAVDAAEREAGSGADPAPAASADIAPALASLERWVEAGVVDHAPEARLRELLGLESVFAAFRARRTTPELLREEVEQRRLEWLTVTAEIVAAPTPDAAKEAALVVRGEGRELAAVARDLGAELERRELDLATTPDDLGGLLASAADGEVVGPREWDGRHVLVRVISKTDPSLDDPEVRTRAEQSVLRRAAEIEINQRLRWHDRA